MQLVGGDDALHQGMSHDIAFAELHEREPVDVFQRMRGFDNAGLLVIRQVDLRGIAGDDRPKNYSRILLN